MHYGIDLVISHDFVDPALTAGLARTPEGTPEEVARSEASYTGRFLTHTE